jgi:hypothetical protein
MSKTIDQKVDAVLTEMKVLGLEAFEAKQKVTNPNFYQSGVNELPDFTKLRNMNCVNDK